jgi:hypothetical protein
LHPVSLGIIGGLFVGKQLGIMAACCREIIGGLILLSRIEAISISWAFAESPSAWNRKNVLQALCVKEVTEKRGELVGLPA